MAKAASDKTVLLRAAIAEALNHATEPMTSAEIADTLWVKDLQLTNLDVAPEIAGLYNLRPRVRGYPLLRIPAGKGRFKWSYFNPKVVTLVAPPKAAAPAPPVNTVNSDAPAFEFNPVDFDPVTPDVSPTPTESVSVPAGLKSMRLSVGGVTITFEFTS
jgi:hypothetical protein